MKSKFIVFDGIDGCGKSTNIKFLKKHIENKYGVNVTVVREPGGTPVAELLRSIAKGEIDGPISKEKIQDKTELLLMFAARSQLIEGVIKPELEKGNWVIADRFTSSTIAYQGHGRGLSLDYIESIKNVVQGDFKPDMTLILDVDVEASMKRSFSRSKLDRIESSGVAFFERAKEGYLIQAKENKDSFRVVDANKEVEKVIEETILSFEEFMFSHKD